MSVHKTLSYNTFPYILICLFVSQFTWSQSDLKDVNISLHNDTLVLENRNIKFTYLWNQGNIILQDLENKSTNQSITFSGSKESLHLKGESSEITNGKLTITQDSDHNYKEAVITFTIDQLAIKQVIKLFPETQAVSHLYFLKGETEKPSWNVNHTQDIEMIESQKKENEEISRIGELAFNARHWKFKAVSFFEATDHQDNPVEETTFLSYRKPREVRANLLIASQPNDGPSLFILKESPIAESQQYYPGFDFLVDYNGLSIHGLGVSPRELNKNWTRGYGFAVGISEQDETQQKKALLGYQQNAKHYKHERDFMIMSNTWGDRSKDARMNEAFVIKEIEAASNLGITHFQLDDGWQQGLSRNSASKAGMKWDDWSKEDWTSHKERFPNGLKNIIKVAKKKDVKIGLWFNPSKEKSYAKWERDADILLSYYNQYGITNFKIDGLDLMDKSAEINLRHLFTKVKVGTDGNAVFNLDVTAGNRMGYHFFDEFGNVFLENRYTDWANYYPYRTLRNLWKLSAYVPAQRFQMEFLNVNRNKNKYPPNDMAAPSKVGLNYAFAVTMIAQPLAWMEVSQLNDIPSDFRKLASQYKDVAEALHGGLIIPIGQEPSGSSWSGFISLGPENEHYVLIFREQTQFNNYTFKLPISIKKTELILGNPIKANTTSGSLLEVTSENPWSFSLLKITSDGLP